MKRVPLMFLAFLLGLAPLLTHAGDQLPANNAELQRLFQADQDDRKGSVDWARVAPRDHARQVRVKSLLEAGQVRTATDYRNAAFIYQHGDSAADIRLAHALAVLAMTLDDNQRNRWIAAASWDRLLMRHLQPQWYGTQYKSDSAGSYLFPADENAVTEEERRRMTGHTLAESRAKLPAMAQMMNSKVREPAPTIEQLREAERAQSQSSPKTAVPAKNRP